MKYSIILLVVLSLLGCNTFEKKKLSSDEDCIPVINRFYGGIKKSDYDRSLIELLRSNPDINLKDSGTIDLEEKFSNINRTSGNFISFTIVRKREIANDISVYSTIAKYEKKFYRFVFVFYKPTQIVKLYKFQFDENVETELEESLKLYTEQDN